MNYNQDLKLEIEFKYHLDDYLTRQFSLLCAELKILKDTSGFYYTAQSLPRETLLEFGTYILINMPNLRQQISKMKLYQSIDDSGEIYTEDLLIEYEELKQN